MFNGKIYYNGQFPIAMSNYQRVTITETKIGHLDFHCYFATDQSWLQLVPKLVRLAVQSAGRAGRLCVEYTSTLVTRVISLLHSTPARNHGFWMKSHFF